MLSRSDRSRSDDRRDVRSGGGSSSSHAALSWFRRIGATQIVCFVLVALTVVLFVLYRWNWSPPPPAHTGKTGDQFTPNVPIEVDSKLIDYRHLLLPNTTIGTADAAGLNSLLTSLHRVLKAAARRDHPETFIGLQPQQTAAYLKIGSLNWVQQICETGFGGGHSSLALLYGHDSGSSHVHSFESHRYSFSAIATHFMNKYFPARLTLVVGDSKLTVPQYHAVHPALKCNVLHVDGGAKAERVYGDLLNFASMADCRNVVIVPHVFLRTPHRTVTERNEGARTAYLRARAEGLIHEFGCFEWYEWLDERVWEHLDDFDDTQRQPTAVCLATLRVPGCSALAMDDVRRSIQNDVIAALHLDKGFTAHLPISLPAPLPNSGTSGSNDRAEFDVFVMRAGGGAAAAAAAAAASSPTAATGAASSVPSPAALGRQLSVAVPAKGAASAAAAAGAAAATNPPAEPVLLMFASGHGAIDMLTSSDASGLTWHSRTIALPSAKAPSGGGGSDADGTDAASRIVWDTFVSRPCVTYQRSKQKYHMWYTGSDPEGVGGSISKESRRTTAIGYAISAELPVFTRQSRTPVLTGTFAWERGGVGDPFVIWDEKTRQWRMWYSAFARKSELEESESDTEQTPTAADEQLTAATEAAADEHVRRIGAANAPSVADASPEANPANRRAVDAVITTGLLLNVQRTTNDAASQSTDDATPSSAAARKPAGSKHSRSSQPPRAPPPLGSIGYAWSDDGLVWHKRAQPILRPNPRSITASRVVSNPYVVFRHGWYIMFFQSLGGVPPFDPTDERTADPPNRRATSQTVADDPRSSGTWLIQAARSRDGVTRWEYSAFNPLIEPVPGTFDSDSVSRISALVLNDDHWSVWFVGVTDGDVETVAVTTSRALPLFDETN